MYRTVTWWIHIAISHLARPIKGIIVVFVANIGLASVASAQVPGSLENGSSPAQTQSTSRYVADGIEADFTKYPFVVSLFARKAPKGREAEEEKKCGATLIDSTWILTAAHCFEQIGDMDVYVGSRNFENGKRIEVSEFVIHEQYNREIKFRNDIAIGKLKDPPAQRVNVSLGQPGW